MAFELGDPVRIEMEKWGGRPHWHFPARWLGADEHGDWLGIPAGSRMVRPGRDLRSHVDQVGLVPGPGPDSARAFLATYHAEGGDTWVYVDMATPPVWDGAVLRAVDLDLDVVRTRDGQVFVDDEDEFAEHRLSYGYPADVVALAEETRDRIHAEILEEVAPYDGTHRRWLAALRELIA